MLTLIKLMHLVYWLGSHSNTVNIFLIKIVECLDGINNMHHYSSQAKSHQTEVIDYI